MIGELRALRPLVGGLIILVGVIVAGCGQSLDSRKATARACVEAMLIARRWADWNSCFSPELVFNGTVLARVAMQGTADGLHAAFPDLSLRVIDQVAEGDHVVTRLELQGTHTGTFNTVAPTGAAIIFRGVVIDRFDHGQIAETWYQIDIWDVAQQIARSRAAGQ